MTPSAILKELGVGAPTALQVEFARRRQVIYDVQDQLRREQTRWSGIQTQLGSVQQQIDRLQKELARLQRLEASSLEDARLWGSRNDTLMTRLGQSMAEMGHLLDQEKAIRVHSDMSLAGSRAAYGGLVLDQGEMVTMMGSLTAQKQAQDTNVYEAMALCQTVRWAASEWPHALLEVFSDCDTVIGILEAFVRHQDPPKSRVLSYIHRLMVDELDPYRHRMFPRWVSRESREIRVCDALARCHLGLDPPRFSWIHMLALARGEHRAWVLRGYHRACPRGFRMEHDRLSPRHPA